MSLLIYLLVLRVDYFQQQKTDQVTVDASPVFVTGAGSLGNVLESVAGSFSVNALTQSQQVM